MRAFLVLLFVVAVAFAAEKQPIKYEDIDVDMILQNDRVLTNYIRCMLGERSCTAEGRELKKVLPEALRTGCNKCNEKQKMTVDKVINHLRTKKPAEWEKLAAKFDPKGEFKKNYDEKATVKKV